MKIIYLGDFIKKNGPSMVDINLTDNLNKKIEKIIKVQINKSYFSHMKNIKEVDVISISGVSGKGCIYCIAGRLMKKTVTYTMHGALKIEEQYTKVRVQRKLYEYLLTKLSNKVICVSENFKNDVSNLYDIKDVTHINNGVNINNNLYNKKVKRNKYQLLTVGGGRKVKGVLNVCKAVEKINNKNIKLIVVGEDGEHTEEIKRYEFVKYKGFISQEELIELMKSSYIYIQNSYYETFGMTVLEAIACGANIILSEKIGVAIPNSQDFQVNPDDIYGIKDKIEQLLEKIEEEYKQNLTIDLIENLSWENTAKKYIKLWDEMKK